MSALLGFFVAPFLSLGACKNGEEKKEIFLPRCEIDFGPDGGAARGLHRCCVSVINFVRSEAGGREKRG